jgi:hypothetical protein
LGKLTERIFLEFADATAIAALSSRTVVILGK